MNNQLNERHFKIAYYGTPMSGKATNMISLQHHYNDRHTDILSIHTPQERISVWDGYIHPENPSLRFHFYVLSGSVLHWQSYIRLLMGVDGIIFVVDCDPQRVQETRQHFNMLTQQLSSLGKPLHTVPFVVQYNKCDVFKPSSIDRIDSYRMTHTLPIIEACAVQNIGVIETWQALYTIMFEKDLENR